jgi:hypothetical protein
MTVTDMRQPGKILARRADLIAAAKAIAGPVTAAVQARLHPGHHLQDRTWDELAALVIVLAEAADPAVLRAIAEAEDDGRPAVDRRDVMLRTAHTQAQAWRRRTGEDLPARLAMLEREYYRVYHAKVARPRREAAKETGGEADGAAA